MSEKDKNKVYMPVFVGDWLKGTRGMKADVRGVYFGLLLHQWENGFIPEDLYELEEIEREVNKVWDRLKHKFVKVSPGKLQNEKLEEVRAFFKKQKKNGEKGGRPKKSKPKREPKLNPEHNPNTNPHNGIDIEDDSEFKYEYVSEKKFDVPDVPGDTIIFPIDTGPMRELWASWKKYRWEELNELTYGMYGEQADLKRLQGMDFKQIQETILKAIASKWKNLYPETTKGNGQVYNGTGNKKQQQNQDTASYLSDYYAKKAGGG